VKPVLADSVTNSVAFAMSANVPSCAASSAVGGLPFAQRGARDHVVGLDELRRLP
jgi:hypothetical protein